MKKKKKRSEPGPSQLSLHHIESVFVAVRPLSLAHVLQNLTKLREKMHFMLLFSRQGKLRLQKWYVPISDTQKKKIAREVIQMVLARKPKMCSFLEWRDLKIVYKRYASLYFCCAVEDQDNELITLEIIHRYVELLDKYFGSVCELDIIFNFEKAYYILDEFILGGEAQETSKKNVLKAIEQADMLQEEAEAPRSVLEEIGLT
ncbi:AP-1 complex subunit sigma-2-like [Clupea harengus]|uniref:AP-1 complex subunit sigma-2 n=1 Tax=Clupea harengus TaxID=7950 RepID=A0A6P3VMK5_CLUHA|nr:AP-1 complex subunit sigma-2-like [Clupea harengus]